MRQLAWVPAFFGLKVVVAVALLKLSASFLPPSGFAMFAQLSLLATLLGTLTLCGVQNGVVRQAAAATNLDSLMRTHSAAFAIWSAATPFALVAIFLGRDLASNILLGKPADWATVLAIALTASAGAPSAIWCALLTGRKRIGQSLSAQAAGLFVGAAAAAWRITAHDPAGAALGLSAGSLVTASVALPFALRLGLPLFPRAFSWPAVRTLLGYSAAFATTAGYAALIAFALRWVYREHFGVVQLGYWLAANRVSDMSTQLLGLFMIQAFVPHMATLADESSKRAFLVRCWVAGAAAMAGILLIFSQASGPLIHLFLSDTYLPSASIIRTYMIGDFLRVWATLAIHTALANGRPLRYAGIEAATLTIMAMITAALIANGDPNAPQTGYVIAYGFAAAAISAIFLLKPVRRAVG